VKSWENLTRKSYRLSNSPVRCSHCTLENRKSTVIFIHVSDYLHSHKKTICNPLAHPTWKYHHINLWIVKLFHLTKGSLCSLRRWRLWKEPVVGCRRWLWKEPVVTVATEMSGKQCHSMCSVTTFCINTCFQSSSTPSSRVVHHAVLKFSPRRN